jgi:hypothetical protein
MWLFRLCEREIISGQIGSGGIKENDGGGEFNYDIL